MRLLKSIRNVLKLAGLVCVRPRDALWFIRGYGAWQRGASSEWRARISEIKPYLDDRHDAAGTAKGHYFLQDLWAAQRVFRHQAADHVDVGSRVDGFVAHVASFRPVRYVDIRVIETAVPNLIGVRGSVCELPFADRSIASLSCLHVIEHIGLGRYGDPLDPDGWKLALSELERVLAPGGRLLVGTPCGRQRVVFHAHRVFDPRMIVDAMPGLRLEEFSLIENGGSTAWRENVGLDAAAKLDFGCGLFVFTRPA